MKALLADTPPRTKTSAINSPNNKARKHRRNLRKKQTGAEQKLWNALRSRQLEKRKFRRQHSIGPFIVDFYCYQERLIVEVDGAVHDDPYRATCANERQQALEEEGYHVLRFTNEMVEKHCEDVLSCIADAFVG